MNENISEQKALWLHAAQAGVVLSTTKEDEEEVKNLG